MSNLPSPTDWLNLVDLGRCWGGWAGGKQDMVAREACQTGPQARVNKQRRRTEHSRAVHVVLGHGTSETILVNTDAHPACLTFDTGRTGNRPCDLLTAASRVPFFRTGLAELRLVLKVPDGMLQGATADKKLARAERHCIIASTLHPKNPFTYSPPHSTTTTTTTTITAIRA